jgi:hypothetical protein
MKKYEFKIISVSESKLLDLRIKLDSLGKEGWDVFQYNTTLKSNTWIQHDVLMRRELKDEE